MILSSDRLHLKPPKPPKSQEDSITISKHNKKSASTPRFSVKLSLPSVNYDVI